LKTVKVLRTVADEEAFHFYEDLGKPLGCKARSLFELLDRVRLVKLESLQFHFQRKDFRNWIGKTLGDRRLASSINRIRDKGNFRKKLHTTIGKRVNELKSEELISFTVNFNPNL
jgi:hypothetical protein